MNKSQETRNFKLRKSSALFWATSIIPIAIIGIGINFILNPVGASAAYGVPITDPTAFPFMWIKGIRDIFSGLVILALFWKGSRSMIATIFAISIFIPFCDGLVIIGYSGLGGAPLIIHWGTAVYMLIVAAFLFRQRKGEITD